jgi:antitoxin CptB
MTGGTGERRATRLKRLRLRAWRRGTREMDLVLGRYADAELDRMDEAALDLFEALIACEDPELTDWVTGHAAPPARFAALVARLGRQAARPPGRV